jgi:class 3 adenylate cyclase
MPPHEVVELLDAIFSDFDLLAERHGLEKIKTIGDAYMIAGGIPTPRPDHVSAVAEMGLSMWDVAANHLQLALDPDHTLAGVVPCHLQDQADQFGIERWPEDE